MMYSEKDLVRIARRENNKKRNYLVVNKLQGKHIPVKPAEAFEMFRCLARTLEDAYRGEQLLVIGFAETATAIGAAVAIEAGAKYMQTTREIVPGAEYLFFSEEHSHATEQKLVKDDLDKVVGSVDRIIFAEDEVTTGKTILNIVDILEKNYPGRLKFSVASLLNGMDEAALEVYRQRNMKLHYIVKTNHKNYAAIADRFAGNGTYVACNTENGILPIQKIEIASWENARRLVEAASYEKSCEALWQELRAKLDMEDHGDILVLGTEEFMYPALFVAGKIEQCGVNVKCHATTRSPIAVSEEMEYPLHTRYELRSFYDRERVTFIYDLERYDHVLIVTDAQNEEPDGICSLVNALRMTGNDMITLVRWCEK